MDVSAPCWLGPQVGDLKGGDKILIQDPLKVLSEESNGTCRLSPEPQLGSQLNTPPVLCWVISPMVASGS